MNLRTYPRRLQVVGRKAYAITLPKRWVLSHNLERGSIVYLVERADGSLVVVPETRLSEDVTRKAALYTTTSELAELERNVIALYEAGYDVIRVVVRPRVTNSFMRELRKVLYRLSGLEVIEEGTDYVVLQVVLDPSKLSFPRVLERMEVLVRSSVKDLEEYSTSGDRELLILLRERDDEVDKYYFLLNRLASVIVRRPELAGEMGLDSLLELVPVLYYGKTLERMGDTLSQLAMYLMELRAPLDLELVKRMERALRLAILTFRRGDTTAARKLSRECSEFFSRPSGEVLSDPRLYLTGNFLSLCLDVIEAYVELAATKVPSV